MKARENYARLLVIALVLVLGILVAFQVYLLREPERIQTVLAADQARRVERGQLLYAANCAECHGANGEGNNGPSLNNKKFLKNTHDEVIFNLISSGVPGTAMPAWSQLHGGPFTDEQVRDLVAYVRNWEATATDVVQPTRAQDAARGAVIYGSTCYVCHGVNGEGKTAPALNSKEFLAKFDDAWLRQTIAQGRPGKGMPTRRLMT